MMNCEPDEAINDVEKYGFLMKKTSKGMWVNRFFATEQNYLHYWHEKREYDDNMPSREKYDIAEIKIIEKQSTHGIVMCFMNNSKFKLELKAAQVTERNDWIDFLEAKQKLYSMDDFLSDIKFEAITFRTVLFKSMLLLSEKDQNKWILNRLDEAFEISADEKYSQQLRSNSNNLLLAACRGIHELIQTCNDCLEEMKSREPKIIAHCRNYIRRYIDIVKGRIILELLYLPGIEKKQFEELGETALCTALILTTQLEYLNDHFAFIQKEFFITFDKTIFSTGDIISALLKLAVKRIDALFINLLSFSPNQRGDRILNIPNILLEFLHLIHNDLTDEELYKLVIEKSITAQLLAFCDHLSLLTFEEYDESSLLSHILVCNTLCTTLSTVLIDIHTRQVLLQPTLTLSIDANQSLPTQYMKIPPAVIDCIHTCCQRSAYQALITMIQFVQQSKVQGSGLLKDFFYEKRDGWIGGVLCCALTNSLLQWIYYMEEKLPIQYHTIIRIEICRITFFMYIQQLVSIFIQYSSTTQIMSSLRTNTTTMIVLPFTKSSIQQIEYDLLYLVKWMKQIVCKIEQQAIEEKVMLDIFQQFLTCPEGNALTIFANTILQFGISNGLYFYDLFRFFLKLRSDISSKTRKSILAICYEFIQQAILSTTVNPDILSGTIVTNRAQGIMETLCPHIGIMHMTGSKWKIELPQDPTAIRLTVTLIVTDTINRAMAAKKRGENSSMPTVSSITPSTTTATTTSRMMTSTPLPPVPAPVEVATITADHNNDHLNTTECDDNNHSNTEEETPSEEESLTPLIAPQDDTDTITNSSNHGTRRASFLAPTPGGKKSIAPPAVPSTTRRATFVTTPSSSATSAAPIAATITASTSCNQLFAPVIPSSGEEEEEEDKEEEGMKNLTLVEVVATDSKKSEGDHDDTLSPSSASVTVTVLNSNNTTKPNRPSPPPPPPPKPIRRGTITSTPSTPTTTTTNTNTNTTTTANTGTTANAPNLTPQQALEQLLLSAQRNLTESNQ